MKVNTTRFGLIEVDEERIMVFPEGLLGFPDYTRYALVQTNNEGTFFWMQSVERPDLAFVVCDPLLFIPDYQVPTKPENLEELSIKNMDDVQVLIIANKVDGVVTGNLQGPLVINAANLTGKQLVLSEKKYSTRHPLVRLDNQPAQVPRTA